MALDMKALHDQIWQLIGYYSRKRDACSRGSIEAEDYQVKISRYAECEQYLSQHLHVDTNAMLDDWDDQDVHWCSQCNNETVAWADDICTKCFIANDRVANGQHSGCVRGANG
jgi:hypothetical protein